VVGAGFAQLLLAEVTVRNTDPDCAGGMCCGDVVRSVAENEHAVGVEARAQTSRLVCFAHPSRLMGSPFAVCSRSGVAVPGRAAMPIET
jgi:hypothetical protein